MDTRSRIDQTLIAARRGDRRAAAELLPLLYRELRQLGRSLLERGPPGQTLQATALVHEAYVKLVGKMDPGWDGRGHFFGAAARAMREILVDQARRKAALKRGGDRKRADIDADALAVESPCDDVLALEEALAKLEADDPTKGEIVNLRFFAGLSVEETANALGLSKTKVEREWRYIRAWLHKEIDQREDRHDS